MREAGGGRRERGDGERGVSQTWTSVRWRMADVSTSVRTRSAATSAPVTTASPYTTTSTTARKVCPGSGSRQCKEGTPTQR